MLYFIGLGNPDAEYEGTRHNIGRDVLEKLRKKYKMEPWDEEKKSKGQALVSKGKIGKKPVTLILPETYMNNSGKVTKFYVTNKKLAAKTVVLYDDLDMGIGALKFSFNKSSGGHKGVESIIKNLRTKEFWRLRIGISAVTPKGKVKKVSGEEKVRKHVLGKFSPKEQDVVKKTEKNIVKALELFAEVGPIKAMNQANGWK